MMVTVHVLTAHLIITTDDSRALLSPWGARGAGRHAGEGPNWLDKKVNLVCYACHAISLAGYEDFHLLDFVDRSSHLHSGMVASSHETST